LVSEEAIALVKAHAGCGRSGGAPTTSETKSAMLFPLCTCNGHCDRRGERPLLYAALCISRSHKRQRFGRAPVASDLGPSPGMTNRIPPAAIYRVRRVSKSLDARRVAASTDRP